MTALPGPDAFPELATPTPGEDGDDFLDALLGMDTLGVTETVKWPEKDAGGISGGGGGVGGASVGGAASAGVAGSRERGRGGGAGKTEAWGAGSPAAFGVEDSGDSVLDDLLGLELGVTPIPAVAQSALNFPEGSGRLLVTAAVGGDATTVETPTAAGVFGGASSAVQDETARDLRRGGVETRDGEVEAAVSVPSPPFDGAELGRLCAHLNDRNRRAKRLAQRCQEMFLRLFFKVGGALVVLWFWMYLGNFRFVVLFFL